MPYDTRGIGTHLAPPTPEENATCPRCGGDYRRLDCRSTERCHAPIERTTDDRHPLSRDPKEAPPMPHESHNEAVKPRSARIPFLHIKAAEGRLSGASRALAPGELERLVARAVEAREAGRDTACPRCGGDRRRLDCRSTELCHMGEMKR